MLSEVIGKSPKKNKSVIPFKKFPLAEEGASWDAGAVVKEADADDLKIICAWYDSENADVKSSYKLPHHLGSGDGHKTVWSGVKAAMGALLGARDGVDIPEADKQGVYNHLKKHYAEFEKEAPEMRSYSAQELKSMFHEEKEFEMNEKDFDEKISKAIEPLLAEIKTLKLQQKAGAKFSADTVEKMGAAMEHIMNGYKCLKGLMDGSGEDPAGNSQTETTPGTDRNGNVPASSDMDEDDAGTKGLDLTGIDLDKYFK
jgi:hypothetical protein